MRPRILFVEEDLAVRDTATLLLESAGFDVVEASDGQRGLDVGRERPVLELLELGDPAVQARPATEPFVALGRRGAGLPVLAGELVDRPHQRVGRTEGLPPRRGRWHPTTVARTLARGAR